MSRSDRSRPVVPRRWALATAAGLAALSPATVGIVAATAGQVQAQTGEAGEVGEAGEAGVPMNAGPSEFLTQLGYFEGAYRIAARLSLAGKGALAREHLEESHHAYYEDIEDDLARYGAPGFEDEAEAFVTAVAQEAGADAVQARFDALIAALRAAGAAAEAPRCAQVQSLHALMQLAASEYDGGVEDGVVELPIEFRDSWGFFATARARAEDLRQAGDPVLARAGADVLAQMDGIEQLYPSLDADHATVDPAQLSVAAGWIEIIALRLK